MDDNVLNMPISRSDALLLQALVAHQLHGYLDLSGEGVNRSVTLEQTRHLYELLHTVNRVFSARQDERDALVALGVIA